MGLTAVIALGLASRESPALFPAFLDKYPGDALWALMIFLLWGLMLPRASTSRIAALAFAVSCSVEVSQLYHAPWLDELRDTLVGRLTLGSTFLWWDLVAYGVGVAVGVLIDGMLFRASARASGE